MSLIGIFAWLTSAIFLAAITLLVHRHLRAARPGIDLLGLLALFIYLVTLHQMVVGLTGLLKPIPIAGISLVGLVALLTNGRTRSVLLSGIQDAGEILGSIQSTWFDLPIWLRWVSAGFAVFSALRFAFLIWALPPFVWDSLTYHLTNVAHWTQVGRIELFATPVDRIYTPANYEALASWFTVFLHHDVVVEAAGLPAYALSMVAVYAASRSLGLGRTGAWLASLSYLSTPALIIAATGTKNDPHMAAFFLASLALIADWTRVPKGYEQDSLLGRLVLLILIIFLAAGTKTYIAHMLPGLVLIGALLVWTTREVSFRRLAHRLLEEWRERERLAISLFVVLLFTGLFVGGYWNIRNWALTGNPFYPYGVELGGADLAPGPLDYAGLDLDRAIENLKLIAGKFGDWQDPIRPDLPNTTGWGWFAYVLGLPALAWGLIRDFKVRILTLGFVLSFVLILGSTKVDPWNMRYLIWFPVLFSFSFAALHGAGRDSSRLFSAWMAGLVTLTVGLNFLMTVNYNRISADEFREILARPVWERHSAVFMDSVPVPYADAVEYVPATDRLGYNVHENGFVYPLYRADYSQQIVFVPFTASSTCAEIAESMRQRGTRHLLVAPEHTPDDRIGLLESCAQSGQILRERGRNLYVLAR